MEVENLAQHARGGRDAPRADALALGDGLRDRQPGDTERRRELQLLANRRDRMVFTVRDGRILRQDTYDCYEPVAVPAAA